MPPRKKKMSKKKEQECPEEITEEERLKELGIYEDNGEDETDEDYIDPGVT